MKHRLPLAFVVVAVALIALVIAVRNRPKNERGARPSAGATSPTGGDDAPLADPRKAEAERQIVATPAPMFVPMARWGEAPIRLHVLERESQRPIPGASVSYIEGDDAHREFVGEDSFGTDPEAYLREHGRTVIADDRGEVDVPTGNRWTYVCGRKGALFGWQHFQSHEAGDRRLELEHQDELSVRVVDDGDKAQAGVPVCISRCDDDGQVMRVLTDGDGRVHIRNITAVLREKLSFEQPAVEVRVDQVAVPRVMCWIDPLHVPKEPIVLRLPASATLDIEVVDANGLPCHRAGRLSVRPAPARGTENDPPRWPTLWAHFESQDVASSSVPAPIGTALIVAVDCDYGGSASSTAPAASAPREHVPFRIILPAEPSFITARLVDGDGAPMAHRRLRLASFSHTDGGGLSCSNDPLLTDGEGRVGITRRGAEEWILDSTNTTHARGARLDAAGWPKTGSFDLGDVRLSVLEPFVHGHVEDPLGARVASAYVQLGIQHTGSFEHVEYLVSTGPTDKSGEFALYLPRIDANLVLMATTEGGRFRLHPASQAVVLDPPGIEQVLRLEALGEIDGTLLIDDASQSSLVQLRLANVPVYPERTVVGHELRFRFEGVPVGLHELTAELPVEDLRSKPVPPTIWAKVDDIEVRVGEVTRDPRLQPIDLRSKLPLKVARELEVGVVDATGASVPFGKSWLWSSPTDLFDVRPWSTGRVRVPANGVESVDVWGSGMRVSHAAVREPLEPITLRPECEVSLVLDQVHGLVAAGHRVLVTLNPTADDRRSSQLRVALGQIHVASFVDSTGEARFHFAVPGQFGMRIDFWRIDPLTNKSVDQRILDPASATARIEVRDQDGPQRFDIRFDDVKFAELTSEFQAH